jgi:hypothetical protein
LDDGANLNSLEIHRLQPRGNLMPDAIVASQRVAVPDDQDLHAIPPRATRRARRPRASLTSITIGMLPTAWVEQERHGS